MTAACEEYHPGPAARTAARLGGQVAMLDTRRLQLRAPRIYDFDAYAKIMCSDRACFIGGPLSRADAWMSFTSQSALWLLHGHGLWTIDAQTMPSAGFALLDFRYDATTPDLSIFLLPDIEGSGIAVEALEAARGYATDTLKWDHVQSVVAPDNQRGLDLMTRVMAIRDEDAEALRNDGARVYRHGAKGGMA